MKRGGGLDVERFRFAVDGMSGGERRLMSAALQLFNDWLDPHEFGLDPVRLDDLVCNLGYEFNEVLEEAMRLRRGYGLE